MSAAEPPEPGPAGAAALPGGIFEPTLAFEHVIGGLPTLPRRLDPDSIVRVGDRVGLFVPFSKDAGVDPDSTVNLQGLVDVMKDQLVAVRGENEDLKTRLRAAAERPRSPDDLGSALAASLDNLQARLSRVENPRTEFAVREFHIDAAVWVDVNPVGGLEYRFPGPGSPMDPASLSRINLTIVATPRQVEDVTGGGDNPAPGPLAYNPDVGVDEVHGIGDAYRRQLNAHGIFTAGDLVHAGSRARTALELEGLLGIERETLRTWLPQAELITIPGIHGREAHVLVTAGVNGIADLAAQDPATLAERFAATARSLKGLGDVPALSPEGAKVWIEAAASRRRG